MDDKKLFENDEINLYELFKTFWDSKWLISSITIASCIFIVLYSLSIPNIYRSSALVMPAQSQGSSMSGSLSGLGGLASMAGISIPSGNSNNKEEAIAVLTSHQFLEDFIVNNDILLPLMASKGWDAKKNELILIDAGCEFNGYASDITRTFPVSGKFTKAQKLIYEIVLLAQRDAIQKIKLGEKYNAPHEAAVRSITQNLINADLIKNRSVDEALETQEYRKFYMHRTGHWLGLDVHDVGSYNTTFKKNMVLTVEPGVYIRPSKDIPREFWNIGIRIEDDVIVKEKGCELISRKVPVELDEVEQLSSL